VRAIKVVKKIITEMILQAIGAIFSGSSKNPDLPSGRLNAIPYGRERNTGGHDHRTNRGNDRTPAQRSGDESRRRK
jgi:hypothetical protein